jgi:hypothetical protein
MKCKLAQCVLCEKSYDINNFHSEKSEIANVCKRCLKEIDDIRYKDESIKEDTNEFTVEDLEELANFLEEQEIA